MWPPVGSWWCWLGRDGAPSAGGGMAGGWAGRDPGLQGRQSHGLAGQGQGIVHLESRPRKDRVPAPSRFQWSDS